MDTLHDKELFNRIAQNDEAAFTSIFKQYHRHLYHTIKKITRSETETEEVIQEVFLRLWLNRATLPSIINPGGWLTTIAANLSLDALRKKARTHMLVHAQEANDYLPDTAPQPVAQFELKEVQSLISEAVDKLPASRKKVFILSRQQGRTRKDIAQELQISENTVKNQLASAVQFVQDYLQKKGGLYLPSLLVLLLR